MNKMPLVIVVCFIMHISVLSAVRHGAKRRYFAPVRGAASDYLRARIRKDILNQVQQGSNDTHIACALRERLHLLAPEAVQFVVGWSPTSPLYYAVARELPETVKVLLEFGASPAVVWKNPKTHVFENLLTTACKTPDTNLAVIQLLLGAVEKQGSLNDLLHMKAYPRAYTPLATACLYCRGKADSFTVIENLLNVGSPVIGKGKGDAPLKSLCKNVCRGALELPQAHVLLGMLVEKISLHDGTPRLGFYHGLKKPILSLVDRLSPSEGKKRIFDLSFNAQNLKELLYTQRMLGEICLYAFNTNHREIFNYLKSYEEATLGDFLPWAIKTSFDRSPSKFEERLFKFEEYIKPLVNRTQDRKGNALFIMLSVILPEIVKLEQCNLRDQLQMTLSRTAAVTHLLLRSGVQLDHEVDGENALYLFKKYRKNPEIKQIYDLIIRDSTEKNNYVNAAMVLMADRQ